MTLHRISVLALALAGCTVGVAPPSGGEQRPHPPATTELVVIAAGDEAMPYLAGMRVATEELEAALRLTVLEDPDPADRLTDVLEDPDPAAILVVGAPAVVAEQRAAIQADGRPVIVLGGDLYTSRSLFRQVFQTSIPAIWQARAIARYIARDRGYREVVVSADPGRQGERDAFLTALREEGIEATDAPAAAGIPEALVHVGSAASAAQVGASLDSSTQLAVSTDALRADADLPPGTVSPGHYAWAPWADGIPRVRAFRAKLDPVGGEQEGYDAIRVLADALERTGHRTGEVLVRALERNRPEGETFSSLPIVLGPDDHTFADETWVGLYAVPAPGEPREVPTTPWRPIIRTFTYDGKRTIFREEDRAVFFPFWGPGRPSPKYGRSVLGIATGPADPLH